MVRFALCIRAELQGLTDLQPAGGCDDPNFSYFLKMRCNSCGEEREKEVGLRLGEMVRLKSHNMHASDLMLSLTGKLDRRVAHIQMKCKICGSVSHVKMLPGYGQLLTLKKSIDGEKSCLMVLDCDGVAPTECFFSHGWTATRVDGTEIALDLSRDFMSRESDGSPLCVLRPCGIFEELGKSRKHEGRPPPGMM